MAFGAKMEQWFVTLLPLRKPRALLSPEAEVADLSTFVTEWQGANSE